MIGVKGLNFFRYLVTLSQGGCFNIGDIVAPRVAPLCHVPYGLSPWGILDNGGKRGRAMRRV